MKNMKIAILGVLSAVLVSCAAIAPVALNTLTSISTPAAAVGDKVVVEGTRGLILAHNAAQAGIALVNPLVRQRALTSAQVDRYEAIINEVEKLAVTGRTTLTVAERTAGMFNLANELNVMGGK